MILSANITLKGANMRLYGIIPLEKTQFFKEDEPLRES